MVGLNNLKIRAGGWQIFYFKIKRSIMSFLELLLIGFKIGLITFGGALLIFLLLELIKLIIGFIKYLKLQKKLEALGSQEQDLDFEKLQNDLEHWQELLEQ